MNSLFVIKPYKHLGMWVFDDEARGLLQEPFVGGADTLIDRAVVGITHAERGFVLVFSAGQFPGAALTLDWVRPEMGGSVYHCRELDAEGWLCPALLKYFPVPPSALFVRVAPLES